MLSARGQFWVSLVTWYPRAIYGHSHTSTSIRRRVWDQRFRRLTTWLWQPLMINSSQRNLRWRWAYCCIKWIEFCSIVQIWRWRDWICQGWTWNFRVPQLFAVELHELCNLLTTQTLPLYYILLSKWECLKFSAPYPSIKREVRFGNYNIKFNMYA